MFCLFSAKKICMGVYQDKCQIIGDNVKFIKKMSSKIVVLIKSKLYFCVNTFFGNN